MQAFLDKIFVRHNFSLLIVNNIIGGHNFLIIKIFAKN